MNANTTPLSYGVRQAIRDSPKTTYEIGKQSKVTPQNLYRFLDDERPRSLSQKSLDSLGLCLGLKLTSRGRPSLAGHGRDYRIVYDESGRVVAIDKLIDGPGDDPLSVQLGRAVRLHRKGLEEIAGAIGVSLTQLYRFLDRSRGLSQEKLDRLCGLMGLVVEGPPDAATTAAALRVLSQGGHVHGPQEEATSPLPNRISRARPPRRISPALRSRRRPSSCPPRTGPRVRPEARRPAAACRSHGHRPSSERPGRGTGSWASIDR